jgi:DNA polymerase III subunit delta
VVAIKHQAADSFLKAIDPRICAVLFFGPDEGLVLERGQQLAKRLAKQGQGDGEILQFSDADLETDPDRLATELLTLPMFGGRKIIRAQAGRRIGAASLKPLIEGGGFHGFLIIEASNLKPDDALRKLFEGSSSTAGVACFADSADDLEALATRVLASHGLKIDADARSLLVSRLGADRAVSRGEVEKLALYARGKVGMIDVDDVDAIVGDASDLQLDRIPQAAASGDAARAVVDADRGIAAGEGAQTILLATQRYFLRLHKLRASIDQGRSAEEAIRGMRPPVHFKLQGALASQARAWSGAKLSTALNDISTAVKASRQTGALDDTLTERLLLRLAFLARAKG